MGKENKRNVLCGGVMNRIKSVWLLFLLALLGSVFSVSAMAMMCMDQGHSVDFCAEVCSGLESFGFTFCL